MSGGFAGDGGGSIDPFDEFNAFELDDDFVRAATIVELSAVERAEIEERRRRRIALERFEAAREADELAEAEQERWRRRRARAVRTTAWLVFAGLVAWVLWVAVDVYSKDRPAPAPIAETPDIAAFGHAGSDRPTPLGSRAATKPLGTPPVVPGPDEGYEFAAVQDDGSPVAYDPCRPIHYVTSDRTAVERADDIITAAVRELSEATGLVFVRDESKGEVPSPQREFYQPDRYGDRWAPVLIAWSDDTETPKLAGSVAGLGGSAHVELTDGDSPSRGKVYVSGAVALDGPDLAQVQATRGDDAVRAVVLHELAHVLGLDHVNDRRQLMYPVGVDGVVDLGPGDRRGLARLGAGSCHPEV